jgi:hypothetical protein
MDSNTPETITRPQRPGLLVALYDRLDLWRKSHAIRGVLVLALILTFLGSLGVIELRRQGWLPPSIAARVAGSHFVAIGIVFYLLVLAEVVGMIFGLTESVSRAVGKQIEILSLILLRQSFEILSSLDEPLRWDVLLAKASDNRLLDLVIDALVALLIFVLVGFYYRIQHEQPISEDSRDQAGFIESKKIVALLLLLGLAVVTARGAVDYFKVGGKSSLFFEEVFSLLIFSDVLIVLIALRYSVSYRVVFRNSAFALATVLMRLALTAPTPYNAALGVTAALYAIGLTLAYNEFAPTLREVKPALQAIGEPSPS